MSRRSLEALGPANMEGVPNEELVLAEMISNAEEHGLEFVKSSLGVVNVDGMFTPVDGCACAAGAYVAFKLAPENEHFADTFRKLTGLAYAGVYNGNDDYEEPVYDDYEEPVYDDTETSFTVGHAYACYHTQD